GAGGSGGRRPGQGGSVTDSGGISGDGGVTGSGGATSGGAIGTGGDAGGGSRGVGTGGSGGPHAEGGADRRGRAQGGSGSGSGGSLQLLNGEAWKLAWSLYVPAALKASTRFNHVWQMKYVDTAGGSSDGPLLTLDLTRQGGVEKIRLDVFGVSSFAAVDLP